MARIRIELTDVSYNQSLRELLSWGLTYCDRFGEVPETIWLDPPNHAKFRTDIVSLDYILNSTEYDLLFFRGVPVKIDSRTGMHCALEIDVRGSMAWPPREYLPEWKSPTPKSDVYEAILEPLV